METKEITDEKGRKYKAHSEGEFNIIIGPPEGLVDSLNLPEPFATNLHNALYAHGLFNFKDVTRTRNELMGVLQEVLTIDVQNLTQAYFLFENNNM